jgi:hypothetical protein
MTQKLEDGSPGLRQTPMNPHRNSDPRFLLLAPASGNTHAWSPPRQDKGLYDSLLHDVQRFRGTIYQKDGAIQDWQLDHRGGFRMRGDDQSWHLLLSKDQKIAGCVRYLVHPNTIAFEDLVLHSASLARDRNWGGKMRSAFQAEIRLARSEGVPYVELGGWALAEEFRNTKAAFRILLASYAWANLVGGCLSACTATVRHRSSSLLRRIGGASIEYFGEQLPSYNDPAYGCDMELLRFDWRKPNPRFLPLVRDIEAELSQSPIIATTSHQRARCGEPNGIPVAC